MALAPSVRERHVVMCGSVNAENLQARLQEIFHADHGNHNVRWVRVRALLLERLSLCVTRRGSGAHAYVPLST